MSESPTSAERWEAMESTTMTTQGALSLYQHWNAQYDADMQEWGYSTPKRVASIIRDADIQASDILDVGCGSGLLARELCPVLSETTRLHGLDVSAPMLALAKELQLFSSLSQCDMGARPWPFADRQFRVAAFSGSLCYCDDKEAALSECHRVLERGGLCIISTSLELEKKLRTMLRDSGLWKDIHHSAAEMYMKTNTNKIYTARKA